MTISGFARLVSFVPFMLAAPIVAAAEDPTNPWAFLPTRAIMIESGVVSFQAGVRCERNLKFFNPIFRRHPTEYFVVVSNEGKAPIWVGAELQLPDEKPAKYEGDIQPGKYATVYWKGSGLAAGKPIPLKIWVHADAGRSRILATRETSMFFPESGKEKFLNLIYDAMMKAQTSSQRQCPIASGWQELKNFDAATPGTAADAVLQRDIKRQLWREQSKQGWECEHEVLGAEASRFEGSFMQSKTPDDGRRAMEKLHQISEVRLEKRRVRSCDVTSDYEVLMIQNPRGGTDLLVQRVTDDPAKVAPQQENAGPRTSPAQ